MNIFGYNEKEYKKNTELFKARITNLYSNLTMRGIKTVQAGNMLTSLIGVLDSFDYTKGSDGKVMRSIDQRIATIISRMEADAASKNVPKLILHAKILCDVISDSRSGGIEAKGDDYYENEEKMADCLGEIKNLNARKAEIAREKSRIMLERKRLEAIGATEEIADLRIEYNDLDAEDKTHDMTIHSLREEYNTNRQILLRKKQSTIFDDLASDKYSVMNEKDVDKMLDKMAENVEKHNEKLASKKKRLNDFEKEYASTIGSQTSSSAFDSDYEAEKAREAEEKVNGANFGAATQKSAFDADFEKMNG